MELPLYPSIRICRVNGWTNPCEMSSKLWVEIWIIAFHWKYNYSCNHICDSCVKENTATCGLKLYYYI